MFLERRTVSRKTAGDGRLEITKQAALVIEPLGQTLTVELAGETVQASLGTMACTCRGAENPHVHYFLQCDRFKSLAAQSVVDLELDRTRDCVVVLLSVP
ncbi:MAG: hypothetical protein ACRENP_22815 [Longimicrobiales bacterium]